MAQTELTWYGQSGFKVVTPGGKTFLIDPWLTNPVFDGGKEELSALKSVDLILLTHGHGDHVGDSVEIGKRTGAKLVANFDLSAAVVSVLGYPSEQAGMDTTGHIGGQLKLLNGELTVCFVPAWHGSTVRKDESSPPVGAGMPTGLVISIRNGPTIYHTGDTGFFSDMARVSDRNKIDIMLVCIGDHFTIGAGARSRSGEIGRAKNDDSDALRNVSRAHRHAQGIRSRIKKARRQNAVTRDEGWRNDQNLTPDTSV